MTAKIQRKKSKKRYRFFVAVVLVVVVGGLTANYLRPLPLVSASVNDLPELAAQNAAINWPASGQAAIGAPGYGVLASNNATTPAATASIAKLITALCVLQKYPLAAGQQGPTLTMTANDVAIYGNYIAKDGSSVPVQAGEQLTEYQVLQAMLIPSANNLADSLAIWAFGSLSAYETYANQFLATSGLTKTHVGSDASGYEPDTTSTASDLVKLGMLAIQQPAIADVAAQRTAELPVAGTVYNYNMVLGQSGINGLKTGNNDQDLGAFLFSAKIPVGSTTLTVVGAVMNQSSLQAALQASLPLVASLRAGFEQRTVVATNQTLATYSAPWGAKTEAVVQKPIQTLHWKAVAGQAKETVNAISAGKSDVVGSVTFTSGSTKTATPVVLKKPLAGPSFWWRLTRH